MTRLVITQPMFFPWVGLFEQIRLADYLVNLNDVQFSKGSFTNRVQIKTASGIKWLTVSTEKISLGQKINQIPISYKTDWREQHIKTLKEAYQLAPFFDQMMALVERVYSHKYGTLDEISFNSMVEVLKFFDIKNEKTFTSSELPVSGSGSERVLNIARELKVTDYITGHGAKNYLDHAAFESNNISVSYIDYVKLEYPQLHGDFTPYVSILDLIAMKGVEGVKNICSQTIDWKKMS